MSYRCSARLKLTRITEKFYAAMAVRTTCGVWKYQLDLKQREDLKGQ